MNELFTELYNDYYDAVYRLTYSYTLNKEETEDSVQRTFTKLYKNINKFNNDKEYIKKWLFKVAINDVKDIFRTLSRRKIINVEDIENIKGKEENKIILEIPKKYRILIYLYYYEGYKIKEISKLLNLKESNIKMRLKKAKELLKIEMEG